MKKLIICFKIQLILLMTLVFYVPANSQSVGRLYYAYLNANLRTYGSAQTINMRFGISGSYARISTSSLPLRFHVEGDALSSYVMEIQDDEIIIPSGKTLTVNGAMTTAGAITSNQTYAAAQTVFYFRSALTATSGEHNNVRGRAMNQATGASTSDIRGVFGQATTTAALYGGTGTGVFANFIAKNTSTTVTGRALFAEAETEATPTAITNMYTAYFRTKAHRAPSGDYYMLMMEDELVATGYAMDAYLGMKSTSWSGGNSATYGIDMNGIEALTTGDIRMHNGALFNNSSASLLTITEATVAITGAMTVSGALTPTGALAADGGVTLPTMTTVIWATGGATILATGGTDKAPTDGPRWWTEVQIPYNVTLTGIYYMIGSVGGTDSVVVELFNSAGVLQATSIANPTDDPAAIVGAAANIQKVPFSATYAAVAGKYYISLQFNGTTARFRSYPIPGSAFIAATAGGTFRTAASISPGTTFTADVGPISGVY